MKTKFFSLFFALMLICIFCVAADYATKVYRAQGGDEMVVASAGKVTVQSGGIMDIESGGLFKIAGTQMTASAATLNSVVTTARTVGGNALSSNITNAQLKTSVLAATLYSNELTAAGDAQFLSVAEKAVVVGNTGTIKGGSYTVIADDDTANTKTIATGLSTIAAANVQVLRANVAMYGETITFNAGNIVVADNGETYVLTTGDVIKWIAVGGL